MDFLHLGMAVGLVWSAYRIKTFGMPWEFWTR